MSHRERNTSDCCALDDADELSRVHENRPGLPAISYRLGRHGDFLERMLKRLPNERNGGDASSVPPLGRLTYRGQDDPTVALLDACASLLDVLTFYQERLANESFIRTAIERRSVLELARSIGYEMRPGVAASTLLAFTVDDAPGSPELVTVPVGTQVLSIPKKDELPQTFETVEPVEARVEWNQIGVQIPPITLEQTIDTETTTIFLTRQGPRLARGDTLLLRDEAGSRQRLLRRVHRVTDFPDRDYRKVELQPVGETLQPPLVLLQPRLTTFGLRTRFFGHNAPRPDGRTIELERVFVSTIQTPVRCVALASPAAGLGASGFQSAPPDPAGTVTALVVDYHGSIAAGGAGSVGLPHEVLEQIREAGRSVQRGLDESNKILRRTIRIWNLELDREERSLPIESTITALAFSDDDLYLAAATHDAGEVRLHAWNVGTGLLVASARLGPDTPIEQTSPVRSILFRDAGEAGRYQIATIHTVPAAVFWDFQPGPEPLLQSTDRRDLSGLGDLAGDPLQVIDGERSLTGDAAGVTAYRTKRTLDAIPDEVVLTDGRFDLDKIHRNVTREGWVLLVDSEPSEYLPGGDTSTKYKAYRIDDVTTRHRSDFGMSKRVTRLHVNLEGDAGSPPAFSLRGTEIHAESDELTLATLPVVLPEPITGDTIPLAAAVPDLAGRTVIVRGRPVPRPEEEESEVPAPSPITAILPGGQTIALTVGALDDAGYPEVLVDENGFTAGLGANARELVQWDENVNPSHEVATVASTSSDPPVLTLVEPLQNVYDWRSVQIFANVAPATHGETVTEVLGSGDGLVRNQRFKLGKPPLTFVPAPGVTGRQSTLQIRVNGVLWEEHDSLLQVAPADEVFTVRIQNDGTTDVTFGDGVRGARLPSGAENVVATYRSGLGAEGEVEAGQLALLKTKPLGIREVNNPLPASGAEPPETEAATRENAPRTVLVLGRVVSIQDYEDFSKTFPGVGKAKAIPMWDGFSRFVHLTIGTEGGASIERGTPLYQSLLGALDNVRDTHQLVTIEGYVEIHFGVHARVLVDPRYEPDPVLAAVRIELQRAFSYHAREFGQDVTAAEIVAVIHGVAGVVAVDIDALHYTRRPECPCDDPMEPVDGTRPPPQLLEALLARLEGDAVKRAELLLIDSTHIYLEPMT